ncbi:Synaptobrevin family protein [Trichomonas vaginalis G3]|uniref:Synaptobrevin family protein n=1 Tax=Trichomonas vaginalis (strain ATCC PRA-98 / G3) TaxID=412133 RepID=A2G1I4_TRIV3|nr:SNAP receptor protein [Trichomonas vaginalis G3]EAX88978.1 Synaptobrevin family protein [Trichomonas vaginalis G3]KAI5498167.1 SNAP receptor protein [Trichomonas vaginalis G3]|eukprot:XP_001301908.1 Synaptobrevin family protein [Trichomonas vaginalis G3]
MTILYAAVVKDRTMIASLVVDKADFEKEVLKLLPQASAKTEQVISSNYIFSFLSLSSLIFVCVTPQTEDRRVPLNYLDAISHRWGPTIGGSTVTPTSHIYDKQFQEAFGEFTRSFANPAYKTKAIQQTLEQTQAELTDAMTKAYSRGNQLEDLDDKSQQLLSNSEDFKQASTQLKNQMRCKYYKELLFWFLVIFIVFYFLLALICGGMNLKPRCIKEKSN